MPKITRKHVAVSRRHPLGAMRRAGLQFTTAGDTYDLTDEQLAAIAADPMLVVTDPAKVADDLRATADAIEGTDPLAGLSKLELLAIGQKRGLWADAPEAEKDRKEYVKRTGSANAMREAITAAADVPPAPVAFADELAAMSDEDLAAFADEHGVDLGEYEDGDTTYPDVTGDRDSIIARIVAEIEGE